MGLRTLSDHLLDMVQNAMASGANKIEIHVMQDERTFSFVVRDDGRGMDEETLKKALDPFYTTKKERKKKVGLGLPMLKFATEITGGEFSIRSSPGEGTEVKASFNTGHVDCQPLGDLKDCIFAILTGNNEDIEITIKRCKKDNCYIIESGKVEEFMGKEWRSDPVRMKMLYNMIEQLENSLHEE